jgi:hypothetical protein
LVILRCPSCEPHFHLLYEALVDGIQQEHERFMAIMGLPGRQVVVAGILDSGIVGFPELGGANRLTRFALVQEVQDLCKGLAEFLLPSPTGGCMCRVFKECCVPAFFQKPAQLGTIPKTLEDSICITGCSHVDKPTVRMWLRRSRHGSIPFGSVKLIPSISR